MPNGTYGGVRGRKTKVGRKLLRFPPTRLLGSGRASRKVYSDGYLFFAPEFRNEASVFHREMEGEILEVVV